MNHAKKVPMLVETSEIPEYPIPAGERLESHFFVEWHHNRWLSSDFRLLADLEVRSLGLDLFFLAQNQAPVGTLPQDERILARLVGVDLDKWQAFCKREPSPLENWTPCRCDGEIRLAHPVVTEIAEKAFSTKNKYLENLEAGRERKRIRDLNLRIAEQGHARMASDPSFVGRVQAWLEANVDGSWTGNRVREAIEAISSEI